MIIDHTSPEYLRVWGSGSSAIKWNGAYYYSKEIVKNIIPRVKTDRNWITINARGVGADHSIVFVHNNLHPENYNWLAKYHDLILVVGVPETASKVAHLGKVAYLPLSVDVDYVRRFKAEEKTRRVAFVGRPAKRVGKFFPNGTDYLEGLPREKLLPAMAEYRSVYAVGRTAIEARVLGCHILPYDERFPDPSVWKILDNKEAAKILQKELDEIDGPICAYCGLRTAPSNKGNCPWCLMPVKGEEDD